MTGFSFIGYESASHQGAPFQSYNPATGQKNDQVFFEASQEEVESAVEKAILAAKVYAATTGAQRAQFLRSIAEHIEAVGDQLTQVAMSETALPTGRLQGERGRTVGQLRLFAHLIEEGSWVRATLDKALPDRKPFPRADIRKMLYPLGPVAVFTASNFPLAFSTAGGDTASALAAGCPVIVKGHPLHPGTHALVSEAIIQAAKASGMPDGVFSSIQSVGYQVGQTLVKASGIQAVAFTGSHRGGMALHQLAQQRNQPIPVFAEMGSVNPVVLFPSVYQESTAKQLAGSICLGVGQFCTNPGLILVLEHPDLEPFIQAMSAAINDSSSDTMLSAGIQSNYETKKKQATSADGVAVLSETKTTTSNQGLPTLAQVTASTFLESTQLQEEVFGPFSLIIRCQDVTELMRCIDHLEGQLTGSIFGNTEEIEHHPNLITELQQKVGRVIFNGVPTGVEVGFAMQHGGPYPATTDSRFTSVGTDAIYRFCRPIAFQDMPESLLPAALQDSNPLAIWRQVNGDWTKD